MQWFIALRDSRDFAFTLELCGNFNFDVTELSSNTYSIQFFRLKELKTVSFLLRNIGKRHSVHLYY